MAAVDNGGTANGGVDTSAPKTFTITVRVPLEDWRALHFGSAANSGIGADTADADSDGVKNLVEFAFGLNPKSGASVQLPAVVVTGGNLIATFTQPAGVACITYGAQWSTDLVSWAPIPDTGSGTTHTFSIPLGSNRFKFLRYVVTAP